MVSKSERVNKKRVELKESPMKKTESQPRTAQEWAELVAQNQKLNQQMVALERELVERRQAEELMRGQQEELRDLVENASIGIHQVGPEGKILWANWIY
jgi:PAS domain-containing protein